MSGDIITEGRIREFGAVPNSMVGCNQILELSIDMAWEKNSLLTDFDSIPRLCVICWNESALISALCVQTFKVSKCIVSRRIKINPLVGANL